MHFFALDVETANEDLASICQIGLVEFHDGVAINRHEYMVNPDTYFSGFNTAIHGITALQVAFAPKFKAIAPKIFELIAGKTLVTHTPFDIASITRAANLINLTVPEVQYIDTARVARRAWPEISKRGYGLKNLADMHNIKFNHHNATADAETAGQILLLAINKTGIALNDWPSRNLKPISPSLSRRITADGVADGPLSGLTMVFTGALTIVRRDAAQMAAAVGLDVRDTVNKETDILVVGDQDISQFGGHDKSSKHRKAESLIEKGQNIRIIAERDFLKLIESV